MDDLNTNRYTPTEPLLGNKTYSPSPSPIRSSLLRYLPINYNDVYTNQAGNTGDANNANGGDVPRRSLSQTILSQMSSPTTGFGLTARSTSPSPLIRGAVSRTPSITSRPGLVSRGPSLQSLVRSFINRVSRGTQTDCDDNFDQVSIASVNSGLSAIASDLTRSRLKLFLNDNLQQNTGKNYASSHVSDNEFVEELQKLRVEINGEFGNTTDETFLNDIEDLEKHSEEPISVLEKKNYEANSFASTSIGQTEKIFTDQAVATEPIILNDSETQTDAIRLDEIIEHETVKLKPLIEGLFVMQKHNNETQTDVKRVCDNCGHEIDKPLENVPQSSSIETEVNESERTSQQAIVCEKEPAKQVDIDESRQTVDIKSGEIFSNGEVKSKLPVTDSKQKPEGNKVSWPTKPVPNLGARLLAHPIKLTDDSTLTNGTPKDKKGKDKKKKKNKPKKSPKKGSNCGIN